MRSRLSISLALTLLLATCLQTPSLAQSLPVIDSTDRDYSGELPRLRPLEPSEALDAFDVAEGFELELVASEPLVTDPIAICFDSRERMYVVEMRDYSEQATESLGKIALLEDTGRDGRMDKRTEFATGLSWPTAIWTWRNGVIVAHPPYLSWFTDRDGDDVAEIREDWFVGFGRSNVQGLVNSLRWSPRGYIVGATSSAAATLNEEDSKASEQRPLVLRGRDFAIDPIRKTIAPRTGGGQHGLFLNAFGDKFVTSNSDHLQQVVDFERWLTGRSTRIPMPSARRSIAADGPQAEVFRISPVEPWRVVRTRLRTKGIVSGPVEGGGRAAGYFTGATGTCIIPNESQFGIPGFDTALVCDVGSNLVHRKQLVDQGLFWTAQRIDSASELVRSRDTWFRPVQLTDGPDGAVYIADMYREVIEHPKSLPPVIKQHLDLTSGRDRGRIYRLKRSTASEAHSLPELAGLSPEQWVAELASPVSWRRLMASQLLLQWLSESDDTNMTSKIRQRVRDMATARLDDNSANTAAIASRILSMHLLARTECFDTGVAYDIFQATQHPRCVQHVLEILSTQQSLKPASLSASTKTRDDHKLMEALKAIKLDQPRTQLAMCKLASTTGPSLRNALIAHVIVESRQSGTREPLVHWALAEVAPELVSQSIAASEAEMTPHARQQLAWLMPTWPALLEQTQSFRQQVRRRLVDRNAPDHGVWISTLLTLPAASRDAVIRSAGEGTMDALISNAKSDLAEAPITQTTVLQLQLLDDESFRAWTDANLDSQLPSNLARNVAKGLGQNPSAKRARLLIDRMPLMTPSVRNELLRQIAAKSELSAELVTSIKSGRVSRAWIPVEIKRQMISRASGQLKESLALVFEQASADRAAVIKQYALAESRTPTEEDLRRGSETFAKSCSTCHRIGETGADVGPPMKQLGSKTPRELLETILDPNREVDPKYLGYQALLRDGRVLVGIVTDETADQLTLRQSGGQPATILRRDIEELKSTDQSLMPEGLEQQIAPAQMQSLIHYLRQSAR